MSHVILRRKKEKSLCAEHVFCVCVCVGMCTCMHVRVHTWVCACMGAGVYILHQLLVTKSKVTFKKNKKITQQSTQTYTADGWADGQTHRQADRQTNSPIPAMRPEAAKRMKMPEVRQ